MAIAKPKPRTEAEFIAAAPDVGRKGVKKGKKEQISLTIDPDLLERLDTIARANRQTRAGLINLAILRLCQNPEWSNAT